MLDGFTLIAGPCVLEDGPLNLQIADAVRSAGVELGLPVVFKASFDKANRSLSASPRGPGLARGLELLRQVKDVTGLPLLTDIHEPGQAEEVARVVDVVQIPAFLCRQTDLLRAAGATGLAVNVKKGQWATPESMAGAVEKVRAAGAAQVAVTERGTAFGYGDLVVDLRSFRRIREAAGVPVFYDGTHAVQQPGRGVGGATCGQPEHIAALVRGAVAAGCDGLFLEVHPNPPAAPSDGTNMLPLAELPGLLEQVVAIREAVRQDAHR